MNVRNLNRTTSVGLLAFVIACGACSTETTESENIASPGIYARMNVDGLSSGSSKVTVELNVGGSNGTNISLTSNERLEATNGSVTKVMIRDTDLFDVDYEIRFDNADSSAPFQVTLFRANGEVIDGSSVFLPPDFTIDSPGSGQSYSMAGSIPITWAPADSGRTIALTATTQCTTNTGATLVLVDFFDLSDDGFENFSLGRLRANFDDTIDRTQNCELNLVMERKRTGTVDPDFGSGGSINSSQVRSTDGVILTF